VSGRVRGTVILGCTLHTGPLDLATVLARLRDQHPGVIVQLRQSLAGSAGNLQAVRDGSMDIALTASPADSGSGRSPRGVILAPLVSEPLMFVCPVGHPLSERARVTAAVGWRLALMATDRPQVSRGSPTGTASRPG
jgi:DNA-binding transcriptional LysR family regulator